MVKFRFIILLFIIFIFTFGYFLKIQEPSALRIGIGVWPGYEPLFIASEKSYFPENVKLHQYTTALDVKQSIRNGLVDIAALTFDEFLSLRSEGYNLKLLAYLDYSNGADALIGAKGFDTLNDIRGKKIGIEKDGVGYYFLLLILKKLNLSLDDVKIVNLPINKHSELISSGQIDAAITYEPFKSNLLKLSKTKILTDSSQFPMRIIDVLVATEHAIKHNSESIIAVLIPLDKSIHEIKEEYEPTIALAARREQISIEQFKKSIRGLRFINLEENVTIFKNTENQRSALNEIIEILNPSNGNRPTSESLEYPDLLMRSAQELHKKETRNFIFF